MDASPRCSQDFSMEEEWTKAKILKFLKLYSHEQILWDLFHKHHKIKRKVVEAWKRISVNMDNIQIEELKKRKKNLMTRYRSLIRKKETASEAGYDEETCQPTWYAFELMDSFLGSWKHEDPLKIESEIQKNKTQKVPVEKKPKKEVGVENSHHLELKRKYDNSDNESTQSNETNRSHNDMSNCSTNNNFDMSNDVYEDDDECELYAKLLAKKLKRYPVETRHRLMYTIDGLLLDNPYPKDRMHGYLEEHFELLPPLVDDLDFGWSAVLWK